MHIFHLKRWHLVLCALLIVSAVLIALAGCRRLPAESESILASTDTERIAYLETLGWQVEETPIETLDLRLPEDLLSSWADYVALQDLQAMPFGGYAGQNVCRYTYRITNYPDIPEGAQVNLYLCDDVVIGGDVIITGQNGFQAALSFPEAKK